jgi:hypothetical protein
VGSRFIRGKKGLDFVMVMLLLNPLGQQHFFEFYENSVTQ